ncbi:hypothetical protein JNB85_18570 [Rhizobium mesosinicum]|uniref:Uncharacterized protein n=1 Tax=Rhizobium mesosinicum TaxID=335017 RepID=A0ABS7GXT0_9HYPH|nr:hypothetical protein [Rhizobium mesosinicum]
MIKIVSSTAKPTSSHVFRIFPRNRNPGNKRLFAADIKSSVETMGWKKNDFFEKGLLTVLVWWDYKPTH